MPCGVLLFALTAISYWKLCELIFSQVIFAAPVFPLPLYQGSRGNLNLWRDGSECSEGAQACQCSLFIKQACMNPHIYANSIQFWPRELFGFGREINPLNLISLDVLTVLMHTNLKVVLSLSTVPSSLRSLAERNVQSELAQGELRVSTMYVRMLLSWVYFNWTLPHPWSPFFIIFNICVLKEDWKVSLSGSVEIPGFRWLWVSFAGP